MTKEKLWSEIMNFSYPCAITDVPYLVRRISMFISGLRVPFTAGETLNNTREWVK